MPFMTLDELRAHLARSPFIRRLGLEVAAADPDRSTLTMHLPWRADGEAADGQGTWHGGPIAALIDTAGAFAATMVAGRDCGTVSMLVDYVRAARGDLVARAVVRKAGRTLTVAQAEVAAAEAMRCIIVVQVIGVCDASGKVCALGRGTFFVSAAG